MRQANANSGYLYMFQQSNERSSEKERRWDPPDPAILQRLHEKSTFKRQYPLSVFNNFGTRIFKYCKGKALREREVVYRYFVGKYDNFEIP